MKIEGARTTWKLGKIFLLIWFCSWFIKSGVFLYLYGFNKPPLILNAMLDFSISVIFWISMGLLVSTIVSIMELFFEVVDLHNNKKNEKEDTIPSDNDN
jgi:hypothetical protein